MEYNREEATKAKEAAIKMFSEKNYSESKNLALRAQAMCPELEGISKFLIVLDVLISSEKKIDGETDWYNVLGVSTSCDEATIKKRYKQMALRLHPDKNKSVGSAEAFAIMYNAFEIISDPKLRAEHDSKRLGKMEAMNKPKSREYEQSNNPENASNPNNPGKYGTVPPDASERSNHNNRRFIFLGCTNDRPSPSDVLHSSQKFWTYCYNCQHYHRYGEIFRGHTLVCISCLNPFVANKVSSPPPNYFHQQQGFSNPSFGSNTHGVGETSFSSSRGNPNVAEAASFFAEEPENMTSGHGRAAFSGNSNFANAYWGMNYGSGPRFFYSWPGLNLNLNLNIDFNLGSNDPASSVRTGEDNGTNSRKRTFNGEPAMNGQDDRNNNKKRNVSDGCRIFGKDFSNNN